MSESSLVLFIDLQPNTRIDLRAAARAAIAWADMVEEVGAHLEPLTPPTITLEGANPGSQKLRTVIQSMVGDPKAAIRTAIISALIFMAKDTVTWTWEQVLEWISGPDAPPESQSLSEADREALARDVVEALQRRIADEHSRRVYDELGRDAHVTGAGVSGQAEHRPQVVVPRQNFPANIYLVEERSVEKRERTEETNLVLFRPVLTKETNKRWGFTWQHGKIGATIKDDVFLERLATGDLQITMSEGIVFHVNLQIVEEREGDVWVVKEYSVLKVLDVRPPLKQDVFHLDGPEGNDADDHDNDG